MPNPLVIDRALMLRLAELARLQVPADRLPILRERLERIVAAFQSLQDADDAGPPPSPPSVAPLRLRADEPGPALPTAMVFANAPARAGDHFVVPRVVEG